MKGDATIITTALPTAITIAVTTHVDIVRHRLLSRSTLLLGLFRKAAKSSRSRLFLPNFGHRGEIFDRVVLSVHRRAHRGFFSVRVTPPIPRKNRYKRIQS